MNSKFDIITFLKAYQMYPCLWDKSLEDHKCRIKRRYAEECLLQVSNLTSINELKRKIRSIRGTYNQEVAKIKCSIQMGFSSNMIYKPKLIWFSFADSFLKKNSEVDNKLDTNWTFTSEDNLIALASQETIQENSQFLVISNEINEIDDNLMTLQPTYKNKKVLKVQHPLIKKRKTTKIDESLDNAVELLKYACSKQSENENEFSVFGKHVGTQLQQLPLEDALQLQEKIQSLLTKARLTSINSMISSSHRNTNEKDSIKRKIETETVVKNEDVFNMDQKMSLQKDSSSVSLFYNNWSD